MTTSEYLSALDSRPLFTLRDDNVSIARLSIVLVKDSDTMTTLITLIQKDIARKDDTTGGLKATRANFTENRIRERTTWILDIHHHR